MNLLTNLLFSVLILFSPSTDDDSAALNDFRWIPDEACESISHINLSLASPTKAYQDYRKCISPAGSRVASRSILPGEMLTDVESITIFESGESKVISAPCSEQDAVIKKHGTDNFFAQKQIGEKCFMLFWENDRGYIYRGLNLNRLYNKLLKEGFIFAKGKHNETDIYTLKIAGREAFLAKTDFEYLLVSSSEKHLIKMLDAGSGISSSILDNQSYFEAINLAIEIGQEWDHYNPKKNFATLLEEVRNKSEDTDEVKDFEEFVSSIDNQIIAFHFSNTLKQTNVNIFENEDYASKSFSNIDVSKSAAENVKVRLDGTMVISDKEFTKEMVKSMAEILKKRLEKK